MVNIFSSLMNGQGTSTIFNAQKNVSRNQLNAQIQSNYQTKMKNLQADFEARVQGKMAIIDRQGKPYSELVREIRDSLDTLENTRKRLENIERKLDGMKLDIQRAQSASDDPAVDFKPESYARSFDAALKYIDGEIGQTRVSTNLLNSSTRALEYSTRNVDVDYKFFGANLSSDYTIEEAGGEVWKLEQSSNLIRRYDSGGESSSMVGAFYSGLDFGSIDANDNVEFTIGSSTGDPQTYSGKISRNGIGLLSSWGYNYLENDADRTRALEDIEGADEIIKLEKSRYDMLEASLKFYLGNAEGQVEGVNQQKLDAQRNLMTELYEKRDLLVQQFKGAQSSLAQSFMMKNNYASLIPTSGNIFSILV
ncbi:hypothetical protein [Terasakiella pusilla]|uniref:hypothetical protein n=1 Tax=Terasakiella pusilla TaxID=64973 RepID=UPI003AA8CFF6